ncbi:hypothetical protein GCM10027277_31760 [Pseudoduganella ginsengisoli]|uniref:Uncharacterized protein n=1 Tax=Pseudoduganella ginsengisoli TaxID=1462440 RepID=A0A6L6PYF6_9BURK|nr:hypothetical protein [Pseudoduganella ginsengisoli]MTW02587.1 hypothetical protein [Pseudoduganella ginsengisoli]
MSNQEHPEGGASAPQADAPVFAGAARRRFTKAGAVAVGAVLTLKSQPGLAEGNSCIFATPSAAGSFAVTHSRAPTVGSCGGRSHGWWKQYRNKPYWPVRVPPVAGATAISMWDWKFQYLFPCSSSSSFYNKTLGYVINLGSGDAQTVARHCIAAWLNANAGYSTPYLSADKVVEIWTKYCTSGFQPIAGGKIWTVDDIARYLQGSWGQGTGF